MSLTWEAPAWLWLVPLWIGLAWLATRLRLPLSYAGPSVRWGFVRAYAPTLGFTGTLLLFTLALSRPTLYLHTTRPTLPSTWVLLDLSQSMDATDVPPSRRKVALALLEGLLDRAAQLPGPPKFALISFAEQAYAVLPLTSDLAAYRFGLAQTARLRFGEGTDIAAALEVLLAVAQPGETALLLSDGAHNRPRTPHLQALAEALAHHSIRVHTVLIGQKGDQLFPEALALLSRITGGMTFTGELPLSPLLVPKPTWVPYALEAPLVLAALSLGLLTLGLMAIGGWFSVLAP